jgi:hypothetical protein
MLSPGTTSTAAPRFPVAAVLVQGPAAMAEGGRRLGAAQPALKQLPFQLESSRRQACGQQAGHRAVGEPAAVIVAEAHAALLQ